MNLAEKAKFGGLELSIDELNSRIISGAQFSLQKESDAYFLKKSSQDKQKLKDQFFWLRDHSHLSFCPMVRKPLDENKIFSYEVEYINNSKTLFDFSVESSAEKSALVLKKIIESFHSNIYSKKESNHFLNLELYFQKKVINVFKSIAEKEFYLKEILSSKSLIINNIEYEGMNNLIGKIQRTIHRIPKRQITDAHGDFTAENILIDQNLFFTVIDPNPSAQFSNSIIDISKLFQSFQMQFEISKNISLQVLDNKIFYSLKKNTHLLSLLPSIRLFFANVHPQVSASEITLHQMIHMVRSMPYLLKSGEIARLFWVISQFVILGGEYVKAEKPSY